ncbi:hypothetical protein P4K44_33640 [Bacillus cereus]|uniref:hypothetical protein n=1 Tax=Bacillus pumilus TaxID=1408 RepID=UPI002DBFC007|nr:hypothetical protein [Bacillus pumilus]MEB9770442.1 hypothetical protein [Bacillus cereus]MED1527857.1 hypothetical protein [Bacillus pumilus]
MKIGHLTFGTPEYVRVTKMAEREASNLEALQQCKGLLSGIEGQLTLQGRFALDAIIEDIDNLIF